MLKNSIALIVVLTINFSVLSTVNADESDAIVGTWLVEDRSGKIQIYKCGKHFCGKTVWIKPTKANPNPSEKTDLKNPDPAKRSQKLLGKTMMWGLTYSPSDREWEDGHVYDSRSGKVYSCSVKLGAGGQKLHLRGYIGISLIGQTTTWKRIR